jgi:hypothetical protein
LLDFSPSEWALPPFEDNGSWTWVSKKRITFAALWVARAPYEMTKIPFSGLSHGYRKNLVRDLSYRHLLKYPTGV